MAVSWDVVASAIGGVTATIVGVLVGGLVGHRNQDRQWFKNTQAAAYAAVLQEYTRIEFELRSAYYRDERPAVDWAPWGAALASLSLVASTQVADTTHRFTVAMRAFEQFVLGGKRADDTELHRISSVLADAQMAFVNAARRSLDRSQQPLKPQLGGPPTDRA
jgi:hypothetical protein